MQRYLEFMGMNNGIKKKIGRDRTPASSEGILLRKHVIDKA
jgi:hypothetical protein